MFPLSEWKNSKKAVISTVVITWAVIDAVSVALMICLRDRYWKKKSNLHFKTFFYWLYRAWHRGATMARFAFWNIDATTVLKGFWKGAYLGVERW